VVASPRAGVEFRILGPLEVVDRGRIVPLGGPRQRALLAVLLTRANEVVSTDRLMDELWGERAPRTAANSMQYHVSQLRKALAPSEPIVTREPGYLIQVGPDELDLFRFERLVDQARRETPAVAARLLREALGLWRGVALADFEHEPFAQAEIGRLEELRLAALERRIEADLQMGAHADLVAELESLVREHPLREQLRALLMRALYGAGRQAEALDVYRDTRQRLVDELGIEPSPALRELETAILRQKPELTPEPQRGEPGKQRAIIVVADDPNRLEQLLAIAEPLARRRELILTRLLRSDAELDAANAELSEARRILGERGVSVRVAAFTTAEPGADAARMAGEHEVDLMLVDGPPELLETGLPSADLGVMLERIPCDVGVLVGSGVLGSGPVVTPFGGVEHDWSAIEVAAWLARSTGTTLRLLGTQAEPDRGRRDASRLLARASLLVQQVVGIVAEPVLVPAGEQGVLEAAKAARLLVVGLSDRWRTEGIGDARRAVARDAAIPTLFVRRGLRPSGIAPEDSVTRFTWTLASRER
jgi:DNA-binding SARP family transcriptional activator